MTEQTSKENAISAGLDEEFLPGPESTTHGPGLLEILTVLALRKWSVARFTGIAALASVVASLLLPVRYTATVKILPPRQTQSATSLLSAQLASLPTASIGGLTGGLNLLRNPDELYIGMLDSRPIADALIREFNLVKAYKAKDMAGARANLASNTMITTEAKSGFIAVTVTGQDREQTAQIANGYIEQLRSFTQTLAVTEASQRRLFYEEQLKRTQEALVSAEYAFRQVQQKKGVIQPDAQTRVLITGIAELRAQIAATEIQLQMLRSYSTERNPAVELAESHLSSLEDQVRKLDSSHSSSQFDLGIEDVPGASLDYLRSEHELLYQQTLFDLLLKQYDAARLDEAKEATVIQIVEPAIPPERKSSPHRAGMVVVTAFMGFLAACLYVIVGDSLRKDPELCGKFREFRLALRLRALPGR
jgi:capsule polysaccharide export protein KpsE/RkpR